MALQVLLFLVLCLSLGQEFAVRVQSADIPYNDTSTPPKSWILNGGNTTLTILKSQDGNYSFNLLLTNQSVSKCAAVVQHKSNVTIWVANFNATYSPDGISSCYLNFSKGVGVVLSNSDGSTPKEIWSTKNYTIGNDFDLLKLDVFGNLSLINQSSNTSPWSSFKYPTDTLVNHQSLFSGGVPLSAALSNSEFSNGNVFYMRINGSGVTLSQDFKLNETRLPMPYNYSSSGNQTFLSIRMNNTLQVFGWRIESDKEDVLLSTISSGRANTSKEEKWDYARLESDGGLVLKKFGQGQINTLFPLENSSNCSLPAKCGAFGMCSASGMCDCPNGFTQLNSTADFVCNRTEDLNRSWRPDCSMDQFLNVTGLTYVNLTYLNVPEDITPDDCERRCKEDCGCMSALHVPRNAPSVGACLINLTMIQTIQNVNNSSGSQKLFLRVPAGVTVGPAPPPGAGSSTKSTRRTAASAFAGGAGALFLVLLGFSFCWLFYSRRKLFADADRGKFDVASMSPSQLPPQFSYEELKESTNNFNQRLGYGYGYGSFSSVFAGRLPDNSKIAVKILDDNGHPKEKEFLAAMATVGGLSHPNLVPLRGFCSEGKHRMLVYELVNEGRSLNYFLFRMDSGPLMDAQTRRSIALETARGLAQLHEEMVIHGSVKPENIMIDLDMRPRLVDYGLVNLMSRFQKLNLKKSRGSRAYMAPEWSRSPPVTESVDVYSFGVVLLELVSGRSCLAPSSVPEERRFLPTWGFSLFRRGPDHLLELADPRLGIPVLSESDQQVLKGMIFIALWCVQEDPFVRPSMALVVKMLDGDVAVDAPPLSPALDALAKELVSGHRRSGSGGARSPEGARFMQSPSGPEKSEVWPSSRVYSPGVESESSRQDHTWLLAK